VKKIIELENKITISKLDLKIKDNLIGFEGVGFGDYSDYGFTVNQLKESFEYILKKYPDIENLFLTIANKLIHNNFSFCGTILQICYYFKYFDEKNISISNLISELKKHKNDVNYVLNFLPVLRIAHYLTERHLTIEFPDRKKNRPNPDIIVFKDNDKFKIDIKSRGIVQLRRFIKKFIDLIENRNKLDDNYNSIENGIKYEIKRSKLIKIIRKAFHKQKIDILIIDESMNFFQIGGLFIIDELFGNSKIKNNFNLYKGNLVFCSFCKGNLKFLEYNVSSFL